MKIRRRRASDDIIDVRSQSPGTKRSGIPGGKLGAGGGIGGILIVILLAVLGGGSLTGGGEGSGGSLGGLEQILAGLGSAPAPAPDAGSPLPDGNLSDDEAFVSFVLDDVQDFWEGLFADAGQDYARAQLVLFSGTVQSGCGAASAATGPFYCSLDQRVYLDLDFFDELHQRFGAPGDFAQAYVIAHEIAHHVQNLTGVSKVVIDQSRSDPSQRNDLSIKQELQADCLAGVWAYSTYNRNLLESGDIEEGLGAAAAVGDDRIQETVTGRVDPESWTHGSSQQRVEWFQRGFESGDSGQCDTFTELD
ncbi:MAG: neutral zinc metallopeptidase [Dehalococcoidia bacterium]